MTCRTCGMLSKCGPQHRSHSSMCGVSQNHGAARGSHQWPGCSSWAVFRPEGRRVVWVCAPNSFLLLVVRPGAPSSFLSSGPGMASPIEVWYRSQEQGNVWPWTPRPCFLWAQNPHNPTQFHDFVDITRVVHVSYHPISHMHTPCSAKLSCHRLLQITCKSLYSCFDLSRGRAGRVGPLIWFLQYNNIFCCLSKDASLDLHRALCCNVDHCQWHYEAWQPWKIHVLHTF